MKKIKKLASVVLALIMVLAMAIPAAAAGDYSITVKAPENTSLSINGKEYSAYKLFDVTYNEDRTAYSYTIADEFKAFTYSVGEGESQTEYKGATLVTYVSGLSSNDDELNKVAKAALTYATTNGIVASGTGTATGTSATINLSEAGYYLVAGKATTPENQEVTAACALTTTNPTADVIVKAETPSIDKAIVNADDASGNKGTSQEVGSKVEFKLTSKVPDMTGYESYTYIVNDTLSAGLNLNYTEAPKDGVKVTINGVDYPDFTVSAPDANNNSFTITFNNFINQKAHKGEAIVITYSAVLNENALTTDVETNKVTLTYSNNPYEDTTNTTPESKVYVYDFNIVIDKFVKDYTDKKLAGAKFVLYKVVDGAKQYYKWNDMDKKVEWEPLTDDKVADAITNGKITEKTTDNNGSESFQGLEAGTYYLLETAAPNGYNKLATPEKVEIKATYKDKSGEIASSSADSTNNGQYKQTAQIANTTGSLLPSTGGIGTTIFYVVGGILVVAAAVLLVTRKRMSTEK